jgi:hypothetical protein
MQSTLYSGNFIGGVMATVLSSYIAWSASSPSPGKRATPILALVWKALLTGGVGRLAGYQVFDFERKNSKSRTWR